MKNQMQFAQLDRRIKPLRASIRFAIPSHGWINAIRTALNMTLEQLGKKLNITRQGAAKLEASEQAGSLSLRSMQQAANAMEMKFVYGFVPKDGTIQNLLNKKAHELATKIVMRTHQNMLLENQAISEKRLKRAIEELAIDLKREVSRSLWD